MSRLQRSTWEVVRDYLMMNRNKPVSMSTLVAITGGRWSANQRLNELIRSGHIGLIVKEMVTPRHMTVQVVRTRPLRCQACQHATHLVKVMAGTTRRGNVIYGLYCASRRRPGGPQCGQQLGRMVNGRLTIAA